MILVTIGTNEQPFDRLVRAAARLGGPEALVVQHGSSQVPHGRGEWFEFLSFEELSARMAEARVVVCHAGVGSIMLARRCGKRPIVVPRRLHLGEAVDNHQLPIARRLHAGGVVTLLEDVGRLAEATRAVAAPASPGPLPHPPGLPHNLAGDLRQYLEGLVAA
jgi:UDP-N-acetylglucosamine transferase subunit ALG13